MSESTMPQTICSSTGEVPPVVVSRAKIDSATRDQILNEIRSGRRLDKLVSSIENFFNHQLARLEEAVEACQAATNNDRIVQDILDRHVQEKQRWEQEREAERMRLSEAGEELARAWEKLEEERRNWMESRDRVDNRKVR